MKTDLQKLCLDAVRGNIPTNFSVKDASESIRLQFVEMIGTDKPSYRVFRKHAPDIFEIIETVIDELITDGITESNFFNQFVEYRDMNLGDSNEFFVEDRSMLTISEIADGHLNLRRQKLDTGDSFTVKTKTYGAKVYGDFLRFITGRLDWAGLVRKIDEAMRLQLASDIYTSFLGASAYLPAQFKEAGAFDGDAMSTLVQRVKVANNNKPVVIAGTHTALKATGAFTASNSFLLSDSMKDQLNQKGVLNVFEGTPLVEIPQVFIPNTFEFKLDDKKLIVLAGDTKPVKIVREGESIIEETTKGNMDMSMEHTFITRYGVAIIFNTAYGAYELA